MEKNDILSLILGLKESDEYKSTLQIALKQARRLTGYNPVENGATHGNFLFRTYDYDVKALDFTDNQNIELFSQNCKFEKCDLITAVVLYMIILDQLGHVFGSVDCGLSNRVVEAVDRTSYGALSSEQKEALKNLRNSLCHNMGLANYNPKNKKVTHKFTLLFDDTNSHNAKEGISITTEGDTSNVKINVFALCNMIEDILSEHAKKYEVGELSSDIDVEVLKCRFTINITK